MIARWRNLFPWKTGLGFTFEILGLELGGVFTAFAMKTGWIFTFQTKSLRLGETFRIFTFSWKTGLVMGGVFSTFFKIEWLRCCETFHTFTFTF